MTEKIAPSLLFVLAFAASAGAQEFRWPEEPENLRALASSVKGSELGAIMRGFATGLGVRCEYCHSAKKGQELEPMDLTTFDFASDTNPMKDKARAMIVMVRAINEDHLSKLEGTIRVECVTCHRGQPQPRMLEDVLAEIIDEEGVDAAVEKYEELRTSYYGGFSYNFKAGTLGSLGERLLDEGKTREAVRILELELEHNPDFAYGHYLAATAYEKTGEHAAAIAHMEQAVSLAPPDQGKGFFQRALDRLKGQN
ncbi:MAG TPA: c-type cytochrome [Vicinamibacteria bacterium]|nr:c-type cytochrome [Vicinamibacteria bacterium]